MKFIMKDSRLFENNLVRLIAAAAFLLVAYFGIQLLAGIYSQKLTEKFLGSAKAINVQIKEEIASETDAYSVCKMGTSFLKSQNDDLALTAFQKAVTLDPNYRDAWVMKGYTELKIGQPAEALKSLKKAEEIDPINAETYELLSLAYTQTGDTDAAKKAEEKFQYLTKTQ